MKLKYVFSNLLKNVTNDQIEGIQMKFKYIMPLLMVAMPVMGHENERISVDVRKALLKRSMQDSGYISNFYRRVDAIVENSKKGGKEEVSGVLPSYYSKEILYLELRDIYRTQQEEGFKATLYGTTSGFFGAIALKNMKDVSSFKLFNKLALKKFYVPFALNQLAFYKCLKYTTNNAVRTSF